MNKIVKYIEMELNLLENKNISTAFQIVHKGDILYEKYIGYANHEYQIPINEKTVFPISSITKQFTAMIIMMMEEEGLLQYEDKISHYLEDFPCYGKDLTIKDLLHHVSGLVDPYAYFEEKNLNSYDIHNDMIYQLLKNETVLRFDAGEKFEYCNSNYVILAMLAEMMYQKSYREIIKDKIFNPLGMNDSFVYDRRRIIPHRGYGYQIVNDEILTVDNQWLSYGDGGIFTTIKDLFLWSKALDNAQLVSEETLNLAFTSGETNDGKKTGYGFGWVVYYLNNQNVLRHAGGDNGFGSLITRIPSQEIALIFLSNMDKSFEQFVRISNKVEDMLLKE